MADVSKDLDQIAEKIIALTQEVHKVIGPGCRSEAYRNALAIELEKADVDTTVETEIEVKYKGSVIDEYPVDIIAGGVIVVIHAKVEMEDRDFLRVQAHLKMSDYSLAVLINFGNKVEERKVTGKSLFSF